MLGELQELLRYQYNNIDFIDSTTDLGFECPLDVHCTYTQRQLLAALDYKNFSAMRQGVSAGEENRRVPDHPQQERQGLFAHHHV